jgi:hypothetical protein
LSCWAPGHCSKHTGSKPRQSTKAATLVLHSAMLLNAGRGTCSE